MLIAARNGFAVGKSLPYDAEVEYLESTGAQWIDTGYKPNAKTVFLLTYKPKEYGTTFVCVYGIQDTSTTHRFYLVLSGADAYRLQIGSIYNQSYFCGFNSNGTVSANVNGNFAPDNRTVSLKVNNPQKIVVLNNTQYSMPSYWGVDLNCHYPLILFGRSSEGVVATANLFVGAIYSCGISEEGVLVRDFIPVRFTNEQGVSEGAMYDRLGVGGMNPDGSARTDGLYRNRGTGAFVVGPDK